ncbi:MAG: ribosome-associated translation inhibitor RaiA [Bacteroidaceae bacterium]|nr:ribosome-associated translation inhibitor RaiA [Bacteroidaceae bacterium]
MELKIKAIHFDISEKLNAFIEKKAARLEKKVERATQLEVTLKVVKPETAKNKETQLHLYVPGGDLHAERVCDTFEEGVLECIEAVLKQVERYKEKNK